MKFKISFKQNNKDTYIIVEGIDHNECLEKAFGYLEEINVDDAKIEELK